MLYPTELQALFLPFSDGKSFHVRYYVTEIVKGKPVRKQRSAKLSEKNKTTGHTTVNSLKGATPCKTQLALALSCFLGLGPAEIAGLQWGDVDGDWINIRRNKIGAQVDTPKTTERMAAVPIIDQVRVPLELWRRKGENTGGDAWVIPDLHNLIGRVIKPM